MTSKTDGTTHADGCYRWGPRHYDCAAREIERLERELAVAYDKMEDMAMSAPPAERASVVPTATNRPGHISSTTWRAPLRIPADQPEGEG